MKINGNDLAHQDFQMDGTAAWKTGGLTKREYFAAMAMQGFCDRVGMCNYREMEVAAQMAVDYADRLIDALNKDDHDVV